jgi:hypothetical protein
MILAYGHVNAKTLDEDGICCEEQVMMCLGLKHIG